MPVLLNRASPAAHKCRVKVQVLFADELTAGIAPADVFALEALKGGLDRANAAMAAGISWGGHGLLLHRVHPAEPSDALLIEFHRLALIGTLVGGVAEVFEFQPQSRP